jgi:hypothetical protein
MIETKKVNPVVSYIMATFFYVDNLLESQLLNLNNQSNKNFEVIIIDPHFFKRDISELVNKLDYNVIHVPFYPNLKVPKCFDYSIFNNGFLLANTEKVVIFQDWRYIHQELTNLIIQNYNYEFIDLYWQMPGPYYYNIFNDNMMDMETGEYVGNSSIDEISSMLKYGNYFNLDIEELPNRDVFQSWGHYCINKSLWIDVNGIDEVSTNTKHYADLDINRRLNNYYHNRKKEINIKVYKNVMMRVGHSKHGGGDEFRGGSHITLDYKYNKDHSNCDVCSSKSLPGISHDDYYNHVIEHIKNNNYYELYNNDDLIIGFQCKKCNLIGEVPHWYDKIPNLRDKSLVGVGVGDYKLGRNLKVIQDRIENKSLLEKVNILKDSWYDITYLNNQ